MSRSSEPRIDAPAPAPPRLAHTVAFPQPKRLSLTESIADSIAEAIAVRRLLPGQRVVELALCERFSVSRVPVREALKVLYAQGILTGGGHRGYRVAEFGPEPVQQVLEVRLTLETFLLRDAIANWRADIGSPTDLDLPIQQMQMAARSGDGGASLRADLEFHRTVRRAARNEVAGTLWDAIVRHVLIIFNQEGYRDSNLSAVARQHQAYRDFIVAQVRSPGSTETIRRAVEDHLLLIVRSRGRRAAIA